MENKSPEDRDSQSWLAWYENAKALELMARAPFSAAGLRVLQPRQMRGEAQSPALHRRLVEAERQLMLVVCDVKARLQGAEDMTHVVSAQIHRCASGGYRRALDLLASALESVLVQISRVADGQPIDEVALELALDMGEQALEIADTAEKRAAVPILAARAAVRRSQARGARGKRTRGKRGRRNRSRR